MKKGVIVANMLGLMVLGVMVLPKMALADSRFWERDHRGYDRSDHHGRGGGYERYPSGRFEIELPRGSITLSFRKERYYYNQGIFYRHRPFHYEVIVPPPGVVVYTIPSGYSRVIVNRDEYFVYQGVYYRRCAGGYQVVETPIVPVVESAPVLVASAQTPAVIEDLNEVTINIPKDSGGFVAVTLKKSGTGYTGPQGEFYPEFPKVAQLKLMYLK